MTMTAICRSGPRLVPDKKAKTESRPRRVGEFFASWGVATRAIRVPSAPRQVNIPAPEHNTNTITLVFYPLQFNTSFRI